MGTIYKQKRFSKLTLEQQQLKLQKDSEYEIAVRNIGAVFYQKKHDAKVTTKEEEVYKQAKSQLWDDYYQWAVGAGCYEEVTPEQQLAEAEVGLASTLEQVNLIRAELSKPLIEVNPVSIIREK